MSKKFVVWDLEEGNGHYIQIDDADFEEAKPILQDAFKNGNLAPETLLDDAGIEYTVGSVDPYSTEAYIAREISFRHSMREVKELMDKAFGDDWLWKKLSHRHCVEVV